MASSFLRVALAAAALTFTATASYAQGAAANCKPVQQATGSASLGEPAAKASAVSNWRRSVILKFGESHSDYGIAQQTGQACGKTMLGLTRCEVRGAPCEKPGATTGGSNPDWVDEVCATDSDRCVRIVKWVQRKLKQKGFYAKDVDGIPGEGTARAIRNYKKDKGIGGAPDEIDDALVQSLRA